MIKKVLIFSFLLVTYYSNAQRWENQFEIGPMFNYEYTTMFVSSGEKYINEIGESKQDWDNTGYESNFSAGIYGMYYFYQSRVGVGAELYYDKISSTEFGEENYYNSITFLPFININFIEKLENLYFGAGGGVSLIQRDIDYGEEIPEEDIRDITIPLKLSATYRFRNRVSIETGIHGEILEVVKDRVRRNSFFLGVKIPLNRIVGNYRY